MSLLENLEESNSIYMHAFNRAYYHNNYEGTKYNGNCFLDYKRYCPMPSWKESRNLFYNMYGLKDCTNNDLLLIYLVRYYNDLNCILSRCKKGIVDPFIFLIDERTYMFSYENRFNIMLSIWDDVFSRAVERYVEENHNLYDESYGLCYKDYFDQHMIKAFYEIYLEVQLESRHTQQIEFKSQFKVYLNSSVSDKDMYELNLQSEPLGYQLSYLEELAYQCSSQPLLSKD